MNLDLLDDIKSSLSELSAEEQDHLAGFLLIERLKRNQLVMPALHQRIEDADPDNWETLKKSQDSISQ